MTDGRVTLRRVSCRDFRNFERLDLEIPEQGLAVIGDNGQGKTNLLESIYYMQVLRSSRGARDQDLVRFGAKGFFISTSASTDDVHEISVGFEAAGRKKRVTQDGSVAARLSDAFGALPSVMFSPRDIQMIAGGPADRRRFLDLVLALSSRRYLSALQHYRAALTRRNAALRDAARTNDHSSVAVWEPALAQHGATLLCERSQWVAANRDNFARLTTAIGEAGEARMSYTSSAAKEPDIAEALLAAFERQRKHDIRRGITHSGPHRDDLTLVLDGRELRVFGSAGQQRTAAIALRMLEGETLRESRGLSPLLLLDDPFAELDVHRSANILELLRGAGLGQTILVVPRESDIPSELLQLERRRIRGGVVTESAA
ncbi:MAG TPA: DNA replication and repair protein RecF [Gemmatimonadaceae bacterium]|nr:DNA replication and repair protein RecF [Gemmatimonadaceae bacterium]